MTDEELVKALRDLADVGWTDITAADRIEALTAERDEHWKSFVHWRKEADALTEQLEAARADAKEAEAYAEELEKERDRVAAINVNHCRTVNAYVVDNARLADRAKASEAKLAKAVEALGNVVGEYDLFRKYEYERGMSPLDDEIHDARTTLAELKGEKDE